MAFGGNSLFSNLGSQSMGMTGLDGAVGAAGGMFDNSSVNYVIGPIPNNPLLSRHGTVNLVIKKSTQ